MIKMGAGAGTLGLAGGAVTTADATFSISPGVLAAKFIYFGMPLGIVN